MISLLLPSRKRPAILRRMVNSVRDTATHPEHIEIVVRFDDDDETSAEEARKDGLIVLVGPRLRAMTIYWNKCFEACKGNIVQQSNDDQVMVTKGWDIIVEDAFAACPDKILLVHGDDGSGKMGKDSPHPFVHRRWVEIIGYFIPPFF